MKYIKNLILFVFTSFFVANLSAQNNVPDVTNSFSKLHWKIKAQADVSNFNQLFYTGYNTNDWLKATVPGTVFGDYIKAGAEPDPNFGDNIYKIDRSKYNKNFIYRSQFFAGSNMLNKRLWLNFEGINSKGDIYINKTKLGTLDGFMRRGKFDITNLIRTDSVNVIVVCVYLPEEPLVNWASPTYLASGGWDWMPYVPGLNMGITNDVYLSTSEEVTIADPWVRTREILSPSSAKLSFTTDLKNNSDILQSGVLTATITPGNFKYSQNVTLNPNEIKTISLSDKILNSIKLWWPNGYGGQNLYDWNIKFSINGKTSDSTTIKFGIRKYTYDTISNVLHISCNGTRIFLKGGNWGMSEYMLRCSGKEYETKLKFHKDMNMNMIRNWLGSTTDEEFYENCDKYGMMVWDDFWLMGNLTWIRDVPRFDTNVAGKIIRLRNYACIAIWCGHNESDANAFIEQDAVMRNSVARFDLSDRRYQSSSNHGNLSGSGFWVNLDPKQYFTSPANFVSSTWGLRTEIGTPVFTTFESFKKFIPQANWWPRNEMWNKHFFGSSAINAGPDNYENTINTKYGTASGIQDFCRKAQLVNIETNKAMYEGWQDNIWNDASGILTWMSQSAYPSLVWQTYDYYYDCNGAYWGVKKACEPLHIQWSCADDSVKVINTTNKDANNLTAISKVYNIDGSETTDLGSTSTINSVKDTATYCFNVFNKDNLAYGKSAVASSSKGTNTAKKAFDGSLGTRWESSYSDDQWIYVDLGVSKTINSVGLFWEGAYGKSYKIQTSADAINWTDVYSTTTSNGGTDELTFPQTTTRYVKMLGIKRGTIFGYSLLEFEVYGQGKVNLTDVHFLKLQLKNASGKLVSENFYWRSKDNNYTTLNSLPVINLNVNSQTTKSNGKYNIDAIIKNPSSSRGIAFAVHVQVVSANTGKRILPVYMNDNYFSIIKGETKNFHVEFDTSLVAAGDSPKLLIEQYADGNTSGFASPQPILSNAQKGSHDTALVSPYPNPFKNQVVFPVTMQHEGSVTVNIYNATATIQKQIETNLSAGKQSIIWNGTNSTNQKVAPGLYVADIIIDGIKVKTWKLLKAD